MSKQDVAASKSLTWLLRHGAHKEGLSLLPGGWAELNDVLSKHCVRKVTEADVRRIVKNCPKQRFALKEEDEKTYIRACQGHSIEVDEAELDEITDWTQYPCVIHGTYRRHWESIKGQGLSRMNRNHIHFTQHLPGASGEVSGIRKSCNLYIYIDLQKALNDGLKFFKSSNNVILCAGNEEGFLLPCYFKQVIDAKSGQNML